MQINSTITVPIAHAAQIARDLMEQGIRFRATLTPEKHMIFNLLRD